MVIKELLNFIRCDHGIVVVFFSHLLEIHCEICKDKTRQLRLSSKHRMRSR